MKARWLKRDNNGVDEKFYPITHVDAIVMGDDESDLKTIKEFADESEALLEHTTKKDNPHNVTAEQVGALPKTGGTLSGYVALEQWLDINNPNYVGRAKLTKNSSETTDNGTYIRDYDANDNSLTLTIKALTNEIFMRSSALNTNYHIFGEHNKELLVSNIEQLIANGGMSTLQSAIQVTNASLTNGTDAFTGTGKGKLFISSPNTLSAYITVDGKSVGTGSALSRFEVEFLQSFSVKSSGTSGLHCTAVFY